jgi:hypothetical protein
MLKQIAVSQRLLKQIEVIQSSPGIFEVTLTCKKTANVIGLQNFQLIDWVGW